MNLLCTGCGREYSDVVSRWRCDCEIPLSLPLDESTKPVKLDASRHGVWRYADAIPIDGEPVTMGEGGTPICTLSYHGVSFHAKLDHLMPTGSYKDRGATVLISRALHLGVKELVEDSSGNAGCAIAAYATRAGIRCRIYVPSDTATSKVSQIAAYGAEIVLVPGGRERTADAARTAANSSFYASHVYNPYFNEGIKTLAYELTEDLPGGAVESIVIPVGNGSLLLGLIKGFNELVTAKVIPRLPKIVAVQSELCAPLQNDWDSDVNLHTIAEGISIASPPRLDEMRLEISRNGVEVRTVTDNQIADSVSSAAADGLYLEPTGAVSLAGARAMIDEGLTSGGMVVVTTGHGLKHASEGSTGPDPAYTSEAWV